MDKVSNRDWLTKKEAKAFIGKKASFYFEKRESHSESFLKGWNWSAMLFSTGWMAYRKMYAEAILYFFTSFALTILFAWLLWGIGITFAVTILGYIFNVILGVLGNAIYRKKALRMLRKNIGLSNADRLVVLRNKGGVSVASVIILIAIEIGVRFLLPAIVS